MKKGVFTLAGAEFAAPGLRILRLRGDTEGAAGPGKFVEVSLPGFFLRRPFSVCGVEGDELTLAVKLAGRGTQALHELPAGAQLEVLTGLGRGFDLARSGGAPLLLGGGSGTAPMLYLARELSKLGVRPSAALGFGTAAECCFEREFREVCSGLRVFTQDGSRGERGLVTQALERGGYSFVYACGPLPMLRAVDEGSAAPGQFSLEARMGCGFGACMGCTVETKNGPRRVCRDGPVFGLGEVRW